MALCGLVTGCAEFGGLPGGDGDVVVSIVNVTPYVVEITLSGVVGETAEPVDETVQPISSTDVAFVCLDELVVGNPLDPTIPGAVVLVDGQRVELEPFLLRAQESFRCGDIVELIISGDRADNPRIDVFVLTLP